MSSSYLNRNIIGYFTFRDPHAYIWESDVGVLFVPLTA